MGEGKRKQWWVSEGDVRSNGRGEFIELMETSGYVDAPRLVLCETEPDETFEGITDQQRADFQTITDDHNSHDQLVGALKMLEYNEDGIPDTYPSRAVVMEALKAAGEEVT